jgi:two-component system, LytTR family, sensor kinase
MKMKIRYRLWHVLAGFLILGMIGAFFYYLSQHIALRQREITEAAKGGAGIRTSAAISPLFVFLYILFFFYFTMNYYYHLISNNRKFFAFVKMTAAFILVGYTYHLFLYFYFPQLMQESYDSPGELFSSCIKNSIPMLICSFLIAYVTVLRESLKQKRILEAQKMQLEAQISQANFNFLKSQINPHFLHNTLNFLYAKSLPFSEELSEGILTLSDIMRYALDQGNQKDGKAPLKDEIEHVSNVIKISQLRYSNQLKVNFDVQGNLEGAHIIPFVLITLVENAFKHGDLKNPSYPIDIKLEVKNNRLYFYCRNKKRTGPKQLSTGIGQENIRKRLDLAYGNQYTFTIKDEPDFYTTELNINQL